MKRGSYPSTSISRPREKDATIVIPLKAQIVQVCYVREGWKFGGIVGVGTKGEYHVKVFNDDWDKQTLSAI